MSWRVMVSGDARDDLLAIYNYVAAHESPARAESLLTRLQNAVSSLADLPFRGNIPAEMQRLGVEDYREIHAGPYRVIYRVREDEVIVYGVADGRRDMQAFLQRRLTP